MNITITKPALQWFKREIDLTEGEGVRIFARYGGCGDVQTAFSLAVTKAEPLDAVAQTIEDGITFFIEQQDSWYFDGKSLTIKYSRKYEEIEYVVE
ncbi:hypothetical protein CIB95_12390 [Lottiidibacillus patelloidae]|uniref:Core domain-containing protein n=1 Tax=Lottiidibacillus patelloidae TaxID=2670334 RepID=A0A263BRL9_9BACI|nr:HesB/YadR/YfhF family protein [Lottiidibacillus patelloidae]OZM56218.1 hypothetical protein CIB95_12390 [Lottiidibacillus patelloidae]